MGYGWVDSIMDLLCSCVTQFVNMGVKFVSRSPSPLVPDCDFRITQEVSMSVYLQQSGFSFCFQGVCLFVFFPFFFFFLVP